MEIDLNEYKNDNYKINDYFQLEHKNQDVKNKPEFKNWYEKTYEYVKKENLQRTQNYIKHYSLYSDYSILTIEFCDKCMSYTVCSLKRDFSNVKCNKCNEVFCLGCSRIPTKFSEYYYDDTTCLRGYLKGYYLRFIYRRSELIRTCACFNIMHIIFCLFFTSLYMGFLSHFIGLMVHPNKKKKMKKDNYCQIQFYFIYSIFRGILMFPYIPLFLPFMVILLLPSIFSYTYYLYIFIGYVTAIWPGTGSLENVGDY